MLTKVAVKREAGHPVGFPAPCYLDCPCGTRVPIPWNHWRFGNLTCRGCGAEYTFTGWVVKEGVK